MEEDKLLKKQLKKNMILNLIAFSIIFTIFGIILYNQISTSVYKSADEQLNRSKEKTLQITEKKDFTNSFQRNEQEDFTKMPDDIKTTINPSVIYIRRNENGEITNSDEIGRIYDEYITTLSFNKSTLDVITKIKINNEYSYRELTFETTDIDGNIEYVQLLVNTDAEEEMLKNFSETLVIGIVISIVISIIASYILSKNAVSPIVISLKKQKEFVQNVSHELRTPLTIIQAKQELLLQEPQSKIIDKSEDINLSLMETRRLSNLIKDLLILSRGDTKKDKLNKQDTDIDSLIMNTLKPYIEIAMINKKELKINLNYKKNINIDRSKFQQLLIIMIDNALKYTSENDNIEVKTYIKDGKFNLEVSDTGIGISDEAMKHIFERFYREDKARTREKGGTGLGLSIASYIADLHGGNIKVYHNQPKGTKFIVKFK